MKKKKVLIITHSADNASIHNVSEFIKANGGEAIRFNTDEYPLKSSLTTYFDDKRYGVLFKDPRGVHDLNNVTSVWHRRSYGLGNGIKEMIDDEFLSGSLEEIKRTFHGMVEGLPCLHIERFSKYRRLDSKEEQLRWAQHVGLNIPATCISNSPGEVENFINSMKGSVVAKMQGSFSVKREGQDHVVFTSEVTADHLEHLTSLQYCPMVFQQKIEKKLELRVTIVGYKVFAFSIDSQKLESAKVDWRKEGVALAKDWQPYELPKKIEERLFALMDIYRLNYGAIDLIVTPDDKFYFLEINAAGEYFWLDALCDHNISRHLAKVLLNESPSRNGK